MKGKKTMSQIKITHSRARNLRRDMTPEERKLWFGVLRKHRCEFRRQHAFDKYILDFYCKEAKLVIEIDGKQHLLRENALQDSTRTDYLNSRGLRVLRFMNSDINSNFSFVCYIIDQVVEERCNGVTEVKTRWE